MSDATKIININDFIFKQNLEFYPNLQGLTCEDNQIVYKNSDGNVMHEVLTFDLRTLPGEAWSVSPKEFLDIIKLNKECKILYKFRDLIDNYNSPLGNSNGEQQENLKNMVAYQMDTYFKAKDHANLLTEENRILIGQVESMIVNLAPNTVMKNFIDEKIDNYFQATKELGKTNELNNADSLKQAVPRLALVKAEDIKVSSKAAFINVAILLYGVINIGFILAVALMK